MVGRPSVGLSRRAERAGPPLAGSGPINACRLKQSTYRDVREGERLGLAHRESGEGHGNPAK